jgi:transmembrane sensor
MAGETTAEEAARVEAMLAGDPGAVELLTALDGLTKPVDGDFPSSVDVERALQKVKGRMSDSGPGVLRVAPVRRAFVSTERSTRWRVPFPAIAALGLLAIGLGSWLTLRKSAEPVAALSPPHMVATGVGVRDSLVLSDGTKVILGPLSTVKVAAGYGVVSREVEINGDAFFDVIHNASKPFTVYSGEATIQDLGTRFAVHSDAAGGVGVTVAEGSVSVKPMRARAQQPVVLKAGDQGLLDRTGKITTRRGKATDDDVAWLNGRLVFRETPMSEVVSALHRWYGIELRLAGPSLADRHLTATFSGESPDRVLEVLHLALGADIERRGDTAIVRLTKGRVRQR